MLIAYGPILTKDNYESFRRVLQDAPATFEHWSHFRNQRAQNAVSKRDEFVEVEIDLEEYVRDCDATNSPYNLHSLDNFAFKITRREKK